MGSQREQEKIMLKLTSWTETPISKEKMHQVAVVTDTGIRNTLKAGVGKATLLFPIHSGLIDTSELTSNGDFWGGCRM